MTKRQIEKMQKAVDKFNSTYKIGDTIKYKDDCGTVVVDTVKAPADILSGHTPVMWLTNQRSCYLLERVVYSK